MIEDIEITRLHSRTGKTSKVVLDLFVTFQIYFLQKFLVNLGHQKL